MEYLGLLPFQISKYSNIIKIKENEFIAALSHSLYKYNIIENKGSLYFKYPDIITLIPGPMSMDYESNMLYVYNKANYSLVIFDLNKQEMKEHLVKTKEDRKISIKSSVIINGKYHAICTNTNYHHLLWDAHNNDFTVIHAKITDKMDDHQVLHIKSKNALILFGGKKRNKHKFSYYSIEDSTWSNLNISLPNKCGKGDAVLTNDEKYIMFLPRSSRDIDILNLSTMAFQTSSIKGPQGVGTGCQAIMVNDYIHLIKREPNNRCSAHWKIPLKRLFSMHKYPDLQDMKDNDDMKELPIYQRPFMEEAEVTEIKEAEACTTWINLTAFPYLLHSNFIMINDTEFIAASCVSRKQKNQKSDGLYKYNTITDKWSLYFKYTNGKKLSLGSLSMDYESNKLYVNNKQRQSVVIFDLIKKEMNEYLQKGGKKTKKKIGGSTKSVIIKGEYHIIRGNMNNKHLAWNINNCTFKVVFEWKDHGEMAGHGLVHLKSKNALLLFGGIQGKIVDIVGNVGCMHETNAIWYYSIDKAEWIKLEETLPYKCSKFAYVLSNDEKYIILIAANRNNIDVLNLNTMNFHRSSIKAPSVAEYRAILTPKDEIHLIHKTECIHWKIKLKHILQSTPCNIVKRTRMNPPIKPEDDEKKENDLSHLNESLYLQQQLRQNLIAQQTKIETLKKSTEKLKISNGKLMNEKKEIDAKCMMLRKFVNYKLWNVDDVYQWMITVDHCRYNKYSNILKVNLKQENINGDCLEIINEMDLYRIGITEPTDLKRSIDGLINNNKRNDEDLPICIICYRNIINYVIEPCHHLCCPQCAVQLEQCPKCSKPIKSSFQLYH